MTLTLPIHDPLLIFSIVMLNVLIAPIIAEKLKLPGILGLIISGVIFGPHLFGIIERDQTIELFEAIGILYIMFQAGLEINLSEVKRNKYHSLFFGFLTFTIPLVLGILGGYYILDLNILQSILLASMFSSHTLLTFPIISKLGFSKRSEVSTTIGGTIITDTLALLILAVVVKMYNGSVTLEFWIKLLISVSIYTLSIIFLFPKLTRWFFKKYSNENGIEEYVFIFACLFIISYLSHIAGLEPIIGAFLVGLSLNQLIPEKSILMNRIHFVGNALFIPYFLISVGMIINPSAFISDIYTLKVSAVMIVIAISSKFISAYIFSKVVKYDKDQRNIMFGLSVNQAAATLAAVLIGYELGIFNNSILSGTIMMIIFTTFTGAIVTNNTIRSILSKVDKIIKPKQQNISEKILIPIKSFDKINPLSDLAFYLSSGKENEPIYPLNVVLEGNYVEKDLEKSEELLTRILVKGVAANKNIIPLTRIDNNIFNAISKTCKEYRISKVIIGWSRSSSFKNFIFGSTSDYYIKNSKEMLFITNIIEKLDLSRNIILIVPPLITLQKSYGETLNAIIKLSGALNDKLLILSDEKTIDETKEYLKNSKKIDIEYLYLKSFKKLDEQLHAFVKNNDLIIQMCSRNSDISWRLDLEKFSYKIPELFPNNSYIAVYPYSYDESDKELIHISIKDQFIQNISKNNLILNHKESSLRDIMYSYKKNIHPQIASHIDTLLNELPIELSHEVLLYHAHLEGILEPQIILLSKKEGIFINENDKKYKIVVFLLSPKSLELKEHLNILSEIAKFTKNTSSLEILWNSYSYEEVLTKMTK